MNEEKWFYYGDQLTIVHEFTHDAVLYAVCNSSDDYLEVHPKRELKRWEETYQYQKQQEIEKKTEDIRARQTEIIEKLKKQAVESLSTRLKLNAAFSGDAGMSAVGIHIAKELEKIIDDKKISP